MSTTPMPSGDEIDVWFKEMVGRLQHEPKHSHEPDSSMTHTLNVARRNGTPHQPKHCACPNCVNGFTHVAGVIV